MSKKQMKCVSTNLFGKSYKFIDFFSLKHPTFQSDVYFFSIGNWRHTNSNSIVP